VPVTERLYVPIVVEEIVVAVRVDVCAAELLVVNVREVGARSQAAGLVAPEGELVMEQVSDTVPEKELTGVTVIVEVLPEEAPGATEMLPLLVIV
jgi:hypothetical protein